MAFVVLKVPSDWQKPDAMNSYSEIENTLLLTIGNKAVQETRKLDTKSSEEALVNQVCEETERDIKKLEQQVLNLEQRYAICEKKWIDSRANDIKNAVDEVENIYKSMLESITNTYLSQLESIHTKNLCELKELSEKLRVSQANNDLLVEQIVKKETELKRACQQKEPCTLEHETGIILHMLEFLQSASKQTV